MLNDQDETERVKKFKQPGACLHCHASIIPAYRKAGRAATSMKGFEKVCAACRLAEAPQAGRSTRSPASTATTRRRCSCASPGPGSSTASRRWPRATTPTAAPAQHRALAQGRPQEAPTTPTPRPRRQEMRSLRLRPVPRRVLLQGRGQARHLPLGQGAEGRADRGLLRRATKLHRLDARRDRAPSAQGPAPGVRDVEPGHPRPQRRRLRRLPHAVQARGGDQGQRPPRPQPAAEHQPRLPDLPPLPRGGDQGPGRGHPGPQQGAAGPGRGRAGRHCSTPSARRKKRGVPDEKLRRRAQLHRKAQWRLDFVNAENSMGFHAPQEAARMLGEAID